jgi:hypothetical protein
MLSVKSKISFAYRREEDREESLESPAKRMRLSAEEEAGPCDSADGATPLQVKKERKKDCLFLNSSISIRLAVFNNETKDKQIFLQSILRDGTGIMRRLS